MKTLFESLGEINTNKLALFIHTLCARRALHIVLDILGGLEIRVVGLTYLRDPVVIPFLCCTEMH